MTEEFKKFFESDYAGFEAVREKLIFPVFGAKVKEANLDLEVSGQDKGIVARMKIFATISGVFKVNFVDVTINDNVVIERNKVTVQRCVRKIIENHSSALIFFHYKDEKKKTWRVTFVNVGESAKSQSNPKRYTYICGEGVPCRTAAERFALLQRKIAESGGRTLEAQWMKDAFSVETVTKEFYQKLYDWYEWARTCVKYPRGVDRKVELIDYRQDEKEISTHIIRLITRLIFVWFIKQKDLVPKELFDEDDLAKILNNFDDEKIISLKDGTYYNAILQNLFFATLNNQIEERAFAEQGEDYSRHFGIKTLFRDSKKGTYFSISHEEFRALFSKIPYLNGGLFECLDHFDEADEKHNRQIYVDGFSAEDGRKAFVPNALFFDEEKGIIPLLKRYNFTVEESTPSDIQVALDPELLGKVFENLLGAYNPETSESARKDSGSFYTPREIVEYMVNESLKAYLLGKNVASEEVVNVLFGEGEENSFDDEQGKNIADALKEVRILDPACGSGAFPMGMLNRLVELLLKIKPAQDVYHLKLDLIQNCIYGIDIQSIAVQISKLRFFISLICEQEKTDNADENYGINTLPNLETKIVCANSLIGVNRNRENHGLFHNNEIDKLEKELLEIRNRHIVAKSVKEKFDLRQKDRETSKRLVELLKSENKFKENNDSAEMLAKWNPYDQNAQSPFFDAEWMFGIKTRESDGGEGNVANKRSSGCNAAPCGGFDIVIGNPPYVSAPTQLLSEKLAQQRKSLSKSEEYETLYQKWDLYIPFMERGLKLLSKGGCFSMIVPYPLSNQLYGKVFREWILRNYDVVEITDLNGTKVFENATVSNLILFAVNSKPKRNTKISHINEKKQIQTDFSKAYEDLVQDEKTQVWNLTEEKRQSDRYADMNVLGDFCYISKGMVLNADEKIAKGEFKKEDLIYEIKDKIHCRKYIEAKDIGRYKIKKIRYLEYNTKRVPDRLSRPTFRELYEHDKLIFNRLGELQVAIDENQHFLQSDSSFACVLWHDLRGVQNKSIENSIKKYSRFSREEMETLSEKVSLKYLLGVMNSKYASRLLANLRGGDYHIYPEHIRNIPIPLTTKEQQEEIVTLVDKILAAKKADLSMDTTKLERQIDMLVYKLYGLTDEEIAVIEEKQEI